MTEETKTQAGGNYPAQDGTVDRGKRPGRVRIGEPEVQEPVLRGNEPRTAFEAWLIIPPAKAVFDMVRRELRVSVAPALTNNFPGLVTAWGRE